MESSSNKKSDDRIPRRPGSLEKSRHIIRDFRDDTFLKTSSLEGTHSELTHKLGRINKELQEKNAYRYNPHWVENHHEKQRDMIHQLSEGSLEKIKSIGKGFLKEPADRPAPRDRDLLRHMKDDSVLASPSLDERLQSLL
jgi:hypothetical protein